MSIKIFAMNISEQLNNPIDDYLNFFSSPRQEKILSYRFNADRNRTTLAELLVRYVIAEKFSCPIEKIQVYRDSSGKPHIKGFPVEISLSHAGNWVICSVGEVQSGVDVEIDSTDALEIAKKFFLPSEYEKIISLPENLRGKEFLRYWTLKESYFKLTGAENFLKVDCERLLSGVGAVIGRNFFLNEGVVVGICAYKCF